MAFTAGSVTYDPSNGTANDAAFRSFSQGGDGSVSQGTSETGDWGYQSLTASGNTLVKTGPGQLHQLIVGTATGNITIYDGVNAGGTVILATSALPAAGTYTYNIAFTVGLFIVLSGAGVASVSGV
jgi:hypothetical protein